MMQPCLIYLHVISLVAHRVVAARAAQRLQHGLQLPQRLGPIG